MTISVPEARKMMGKEASKYSDEQVVEMVGTLTVLADLAIDSWLAKTPNERKDWIKKHDNKPV
ncbi:MAG: hypothetical protein NUV69_04540 [Candidatus Curtissbacteria bacterium]|nr:hypothetical protein [Candidatus Curtissbacteria bacterium]